MTKETKLTDTELVLLSATPNRADHLLLPPERLKGAAGRKLAEKLIGLGLAEEVAVAPDQPAWRTDEEGRPFGLKVTPAGLAAIGIEAAGEDDGATTGADAAPSTDTMTGKGESRAALDRDAPRAGTKQALIISLLQREQGATLDDLIAATGWLPHTTRAALTGVRQRGYGLAKSKGEDGRTVYRIEQDAPAHEPAGTTRRDGSLAMAHSSVSTHDGSAPGSPGPATPADRLSTDVAALQDLDLHELRVRWRKLFRSTAPAHLPRWLLLRILAYRVQAKAFGDLDRETARFLDKIAKERAKGGKAPIPPVPDTSVGRLKPGTQLVREHDSVLHRVTVLEDGFAWNGSTYKSLSEAARAITGTQWNGPRFFGLRDRPRPVRQPFQHGAAA